MNVIKQRSQDDNVVAVLKNLISILGLRVSMSSIEQTAYHPDYPSINSITDALYDWNIENVPVRISVEELREAALPVLVHFKKNDGHFVIVTSVTNSTIQYVDPEKGSVAENVHDFEEKWTGVTILLQTKDFIEDNFAEKRRSEWFEKALRFAAIAVVAIVAIIPLYIFKSGFFFMYFLKLLGTIICLLLIKRQFDPSNAPLQMLCKPNSSSDCNAVIKSPASKFFGVIHLSELGLLYFSGGLVSILFAMASGSDYPFPLSIITFIGLPIILFSLIYQWRVLRRWCLLCISVSTVVLMEVIALAFIIQTAGGIYEVACVVIGFGIPLIAWFLTRDFMVKSSRIPGLERSLAKFRKNHRLFMLKINDKEEISDGMLSHKLVTGNNESSITILFVSSLTCSPCRIAQEKIDSMLMNFRDKVKVDFRFSVDLEDKNSMISRAIRHIVAIGLTSGDLAWRALSVWNAQQKPDIETWIKRFPIDNSPEQTQQVNALLVEQQDWFRKSQLPGTPIILINNRLYPDEYALNDLQYHVRKLTEVVSEEITT